MFVGKCKKGGQELYHVVGKAYPWGEINCLCGIGKNDELIDEFGHTINLGKCFDHSVSGAIRDWKRKYIL
jgi:hypothetical protein